MRNCNACKHINITEKEQNKQVKNHTSHACLRHNVVLFHNSSNPKIIHSFVYPCGMCNGMDFELRDGIEYVR